MIVALKTMARNVIVTFSSVAHHECMRRFGAYDIVITWDEAQALAAGVEEVAGGERLLRMREALRFFAERQGLPFA